MAEKSYKKNISPIYLNKPKTYLDYLKEEKEEKPTQWSGIKSWDQIGRENIMPGLRTITKKYKNFEKKNPGFKYKENDLAKENRISRQKLRDSELLFNEDKKLVASDAYYANREAKEYAEQEKQIKEQERLEKIKFDKEAKQQKEDYQKDFEEFEKDFEDQNTFTKLRSKINNNPIANTILNFASNNSLFSSALYKSTSPKFIFDVKNILGSSASDATDTHAKEISGKISMNESDIYQAQARKQFINYQKQLEDLQKQKQNYSNEFINSIKSTGRQINERDRSNYKKIMNDYDKRLQDIRSKMENSSLQELNKTWLDKFKDVFTTVSSPSALVPVRIKTNYKNTFSEDYDIQLEQLDRYISNKKIENKERLQDYNSTIKLNKKINDYFNVAESYKIGKQLYQNSDLLTPEYWFYVMPGMVGSSNSSPNQIASTAIQLGTTAGAIGLAPYSGGLSLALMNAGTLLSAPFTVAGGFDENYAEVAEKRIDNMFNMLQNQDVTGKTGYKDIISDLQKKAIQYWKSSGMDDKWINEKYNKQNPDKSLSEESIRNILGDVIAGVINSNDPRFRKAQLMSTAGLQALFEANNMRTMGSLPIELSTQLMPMPTKYMKGLFVDAIDNIGSKIANKKLSATLTKNAEGKLVLNTPASIERSSINDAIENSVSAKYKNGFKKNTISQTLNRGYEIGSNVGDALGFGYAGHVLGGTVGAATNTGLKFLRSKLPNNMKSVIDATEEVLMHKYQNVYDKLIGTKEWKKLLLKYGLNTIQRGTIASLNEGSEEGVQYLNSLEDYANQYGWKGIGIGDLIFNDFVQGSRVANAYASMLGLSNSSLSNDQEFWNNVKGGFALGGAHTTVMSVYGNTKQAFNQYTTNELIKRSLVMNREADKIIRDNAKAFAKAAMNGNQDALFASLDDMEKADRNRENPNYTQEDYDAKRKQASDVMQMTNDKQIRDIIEAKGIRYGSEQYATAIADLYNLKEQIRENNEQSDDVNKTLNNLYSSKEFKEQADKVVDSLIQDNIMNSLALSQRRTTASKESIAARRYYNDEEDEDYDLELQDIGIKAANDAEQLIRQKLSSYVQNKTRLTNRLKALLTLKVKNSTINSWYEMLESINLKTMRPDAKFISNNIQMQIDSVKKQLKRLDDNINIDVSDAELLDQLNSFGDIITNQKNEEIQQQETALALLNADKSISQKYLNTFYYGVVRSEDGKSLEYNPEEYDQQIKEREDEIKSKIKGKEYKKPERTRSKTQKKTSDDRYVKRVSAVEKASEENAKLDWLVSDLYNGDALTNLVESFDEEDKEEIRKAEEERKKKEYERKEERRALFGDVDTSIDSSKSISKSSESSKSIQPVNRSEENTTSKQISIKDKRNKNHQKYQQRKQRAKNLYERNKKKYKNWKKGNLNAVIIPFQDTIVKVFNNLIYNVQVGAYKFAELVDDVKDIVTDVDSSQYIPLLKQLYIKDRAKNSIKNPSILDNYSIPEEIIQYDQKQVIVNIPPTNTTNQTLFDKIKADQDKIISNVSTFYDVFVKEDDGSISIYPNKHAQTFSYVLNKNQFAKQWPSKLEGLKSKEEFISVLNELKKNTIYVEDVSQYYDYWNVLGIGEAVTRYLIANNQPDVNPSIVIRDSIVDFFLSGDQSILDNMSLYLNNPSGFESVKENIINKYNLIKGAGLQVLHTKQNIYGTDKNGDKTSTQADLIFVNKDGKLFFYDIVSSYRSISQHINDKATEKLNYTNKERYIDSAKTVIDLIQNKYNQNIYTVALIPIVYDDENLKIFLENTIELPLNEINSMYPIEDIIDLRNKIDILFTDISSAIEEYNLKVKQLNLLTDQNKYKILTNPTKETFSTSQEGNAYVENLSNMLNHIKQDIINIDQQISYFKQDNLVEQIEEIDSMFLDYEIEDLIYPLYETCRELDSNMQYVDILKSTVKYNQKQLVLLNKLFDNIFDAQYYINRILIHPQNNNINITQELQLVASAMEKLSTIGQSKHKFVTNIQKWWITNMSMDPTTSITTASLYNTTYTKLTAYGQKIDLWLNALSDHVINDIENLPSIQKWYSTLLNVYLDKLLNNASDFLNTVNEPSQRKYLSDRINAGKQLINTFNNKYGIVIDEALSQYASDDEVTRINRIPVSWIDSKGKTDVHSPSLSSMDNNPTYYKMSNMPDFITNTKLRFFVDTDDKVKVEVMYKGCGGTLSTVLDFEHKAYKGVLSDYARQYNEGKKPFVNKIRQMLNAIKNNSKLKIQYGLSRNKGSIWYESINSNTTHNVQEFLMANTFNSHDLYNIKLSEQDRIGIFIRTINTQTGKEQYDVKVGDNLSISIGKFDKEYSRIHSGQIVYFYDTGRNENEKKYIGVPLNPSVIGTNNATKLVYLLDMYTSGHKLAGEYDIYSMLKLSLYIYDGKQLSRFNNTSNLISLSGRDVMIDNVKYNLNNPADKQKLAARIASMRINMDYNTINQNVNSSSLDIFRQIKNKFTDNAELNKITLPNGMTFTREDFAKNTTILGYYLRNNYLTTTAKGLKFTSMNIHDLQLVDTSVKEKDDNPVQHIIKSTDRNKNKKNRNSLWMHVSDKELVNRTAEQEDEFVNKAIAYYDKIFGSNNYQLEFKEANDDVMRHIAKNQVIAGACHDSFIELYKNAPEEAIFHEAFHKIMELILPDKTRQMFYDLYRSKYGKDLSERDVAEGLADMFTEYMNHKNMYKESKGMRKLGKWFKHMWFVSGMYFKYGLKASRFVQLYNDINNGTFADRQISENQSKRFKDLFGDSLYYEVVNTDTNQKAKFSFISNSSQLREISKSLGTIILMQMGAHRAKQGIEHITLSGITPNILGKEIIDELCGNNLPEDEVTMQHMAFREIFKTEQIKKPNTSPRKLGRIDAGFFGQETDDGFIIKYKQQVVYETEYDPYFEDYVLMGDHVKNDEYYTNYPNFAAISKYIADYISSVAVSYDAQLNKNIEEEDEDEAAMSKNIDKYDKAAYEFSKMEGFTQKVKYFFATIPYSRFAENERGYELDLDRSPLGLPVFMPIEEVYNVIVNDLHGVTSPKELDDALRKKSGTNPMYLRVYNKYHELYTSQYTTDKDGNTVIDYEIEAFVTQIFNSIKSQKFKFVTALSSKDESGNKSVRIADSSFDRDAAQFPSTWDNFLKTGQTNVFSRIRDDKGNYILKEQFGGKDNTDIFSRISKFLQNVKEHSTTDNILTTTILERDEDGNYITTEYDLNDMQSVDMLKEDIVYALKQIGIQFTRDALDYMLSQEYGNVRFDGILKWLNQGGVTSINTFIDYLDDCVDSETGKLNNKVVETGYSKLGFVKNLGTWQGATNRVRTQQQALGLEGKKLYSISQNNTISTIIDCLNIRTENDPLMQRLTRFSYNLNTSGQFAEGSIILKGIRNNQDFRIQALEYIGFRTDNRNDTGTPYKEEHEIDDYIAKMTMLQNGMLIFPTLSDKGTWYCMQILNNNGSNVKVPGIEYISTTDEHGNTKYTINNAPTLKIIDGKPYLIPNDAVLDQFIEYAKSERQAIFECMETLGYNDIDGYEKQGLELISEEKKVKNYHTGNKGVEPNGTRFLRFTKLYYNNDGKVESINLNDPRQSSNEMLKIANKYFFNLSREQQREIMALTLAKQNELEVKKALELGLIERKDVDVLDQNGNIRYTISNDTKSMYNLQNRHLNNNQIEALTEHFMNMYKEWRESKGKYRDSVIQMCKSMAITALLGDATNRHIISAEECERCFSGHPGFFNVQYSSDRILNSTGDLQKRIGGMVSTGDDNRPDMPGIGNTYTCAECKDYKIQSTADVFKDLDDMFTNSEVRETYAILQQELGNDNAWIDAYDKPIEELTEFLENHEKGKQMLDKALTRAKNFSNEFKDGINVADGAAYITDQMCENLLRLRGAYNNDVRKAFELLRDPKSNASKRNDAYNIIYNTINIVSTKYTAYGFRDHDQSNIAVPYYNKFALFPLFDCLATGKMKGIYEKMKNEKVDMLLMTSAVKIGSQGAVEFDGESIKSPFNKYIQEYRFLRRQLNTDPEEETHISIGTQMVKIVLSNLRLNRNNYVRNYTKHNRKEFVNEDGNIVERKRETITGEEILKDMMDCINNLSKLGTEKVLSKFFDKNGNIDEKKLSEYLNEQLTSRNANKTLIEAIQLKNGKLAAPLAATTDSSWIESILISTINKNIIDIVTPGNSFVQRSVFAMEGNPSEGIIMSDEEIIGTTINGGRELQMVNEEGSMDAVISIDYFEDILPPNLTFEQARQWLIDNNIIGHNARANTIGYRIPTQAQSSIHALRFVDVVQAVKSTIILPKDFTKITGSDFDIDHLYLVSYNYHKIKDGKKEIISTEYEEGSSKYYQNKIIDNMMTLLKDTKNSFSYLFKSIDNDTEPIQNIANKIESEDNVSDEAYNFGTLHEQISRRNDYVTGGIGIGPFALNVTNHILTYLYGVKFKDSKFTTETGIQRLDHLVDKDGNSISSWLSGFINAHVDIVKDPYISKLNVNQFTYNLLNLLIRSGFGDTSVWFLCQPVIRAMASVSNAYNSQYSKDYKKGGIEQAMYDAIVPIIGEIKQSDIDYYMAPKNVYERVMIVNSVLKNTALLEAIAKNPKAKTVKVNGVDYDVKLFQKNVFLAFKFIEPYSVALGNLVQYTKIDTRKQGKTFIEMILYENGYNELFFTKQDFSIWDKESLDNLRENSWIELKTENAINVPLRILSKQSFYANNSFINAVIKFSRTLVGDDQPLTKDLLKQIGLSLSTAIKQDYINRYAKHNNINIKSLFVGYNTINVLLNMWKSASDIVPKYRRLRNNLLLQQLSVSTIEQDVYLSNRKAKVPQFITISQNIDNSRVDSEALTDAWEDLLMDEDPKVRRFAKFLIVYAYTSSGDYKGWNKLAKYVPFSWISGQLEDSTINGESFSDYISDKLTNPQSYFEYLDDIVKNNFLDTRIVKRVNMRDSEGNNNFITVNNNKDYKSPYILFTYNKDIQHLYITIQKQGSFKDPNDSVNLYKLVNTDDVSGRSTYVLINKKGIHTKRGDIYEYGREDNYDQNWNNIPNNLLDKVEDFINIEINTNIQLDDDYSIRVMQMWIDREDLPLISSMPEYRDELFKIGNSDKNLQQDGGNYDLPFHEQDDPENFNNVEQSEKVLSSNKTILSNEELRMWNENGVGENPRILVASEHSDPAFHVDHILKVLNGEESIEAFDGKRISGKDFAGLYLITKHDGLPMKRLLETKIPKIIHFSVTGLGGTKYEPGVMKAKDLLNKINDYINMGLDPDVITIRIDPIVPGVTSPKMIEDIIYRSVQMGIKRFKFSIMDMYPNTAASMEKLGYNIERNYGFNKNGKPNFHAKPEIFNNILNFLLQMKDKYEISLHACAERYIKPGIEKEGCLSVRLVNQMLGTNFEDKLEENNKQRLKCTCFGGKTDVLKYGAHCASHCVYCYAKHENDAAMRYYNEDGTLKDNDFTRTKPKQSAKQDVSEIVDKNKFELSKEELNKANEIKKHCKGE